MKPCRECPFSVDIEPGALGGSGFEVYLGQAAAPFLLHCHCAKGYSVAAARDNTPGLTQCAGAAIYRANTGVAPFLPAALLRLPEGPEAFASPAAFLAHHARVPVERAEAALRAVPVATLADAQLQRTNNVRHAL